MADNSRMMDKEVMAGKATVAITKAEVAIIVVQEVPTSNTKRRLIIPIHSNLWMVTETNKHSKDNQIAKFHQLMQ